MVPIVVNCVTSMYVIGGTINGLTSAPISLQNNSGDDLQVATDGAFAFPTPVLDGAHYAVTIKNQPNVPRQTCNVSNRTGAVNGRNVANVNITCVTQTPRTISGVANGVCGERLSLRHGVQAT